MLKGIKDFVKFFLYPAKVRDRWSAQTQIGQRNLLLHYQYLKKEGKQLPSYKDVGFRCFSQFEEDGILLYIFSLLEMNNKTFVEIGCDDGVNSNSANLYFNFGFHGLFIDGNQKAVKRGERFFRKYPHSWFYPPKFLHAFVNKENINELIGDAGFKGEIGLLSIDIDGNDYWVWDALEVVSPQVVIIETHNEFGLNDIVVPYDANYAYPGKHPVYHGASPVAMTKLADKKGYRLVACNAYGYNFIYIKKGLLTNELPTISVDSVLNHPSNKEAQERFEAVKDWDFIQPIN